MIVLIAGIPRSGSTFAFNIAREVLQANGTVYYEAQHDVMGAVERSGSADHVLLKAHYLDLAGLALARHSGLRMIFTTRSMADAVASWFEAFPDCPEETCWHIMRSSLGLYREVGHLGLRVRYETINRQPWLAAWRIARYIWPNVGPSKVAKIARRYRKKIVKQQADTLCRHDAQVRSIGFTFYDEVTFFHRRHVSPRSNEPAERRVAPEILARAQSEIGW